MKLSPYSDRVKFWKNEILNKLRQKYKTKMAIQEHLQLAQVFIVGGRP